MASLIDLHSAIRNDTEGSMRDIFRRFQCLALLPADDIEQVFLKLSQDALKLSVHFAKFIDYFDHERVYRVKPQHFSVFLRGTRTTSAAESFNAKVNKAFKTHGNFYHFCEKLQLEELASTEDLEKYVNGKIAKTYRKPFLKERSELITKYSMLLKTRKIAPYMFLKTMANIKNKIIYSDSDISLNDVEVELSNQTELMQGDDFVSPTLKYDDEYTDELIYAHGDESPLEVSTLLSDEENDRISETVSTLATQDVNDIQYGEFIDIDYVFSFNLRRL